MDFIISWIYSIFGDLTTPIIIQSITIIEAILATITICIGKSLRKGKAYRIPLALLLAVALIIPTAYARYYLGEYPVLLQILTMVYTFAIIFSLMLIVFKTSTEQRFLDMVAAMALIAIVGRAYSLILNICGVDDKTSLSFSYEWPIWLQYLTYWMVHIALFAIFIPYFIKKRTPIKSKKMKRWAIVISLIFVLVLDLSLSFARNYDNMSPISFVNKALCILLGISTLLIQNFFYYANNKYEEQLLIEEMMKEEQIQFENVRSSISIINSKLHDLTHQIEEFQNRITAEELESFKAAAASYDSLFDTGNRVLDIILYERKMICVDKKIIFSSLADGSAVAHIDTTSLYSLLSNAIGNAIEASVKIDEEDRFISVNIYKKQGLGYIEISNRFNGLINKNKNGIPISDKQDDTSRHGLGYLSMNYIVSKYNGYLLSHDENNIYTLSIIFPLP